MDQTTMEQRKELHAGRYIDLMVKKGGGRGQGVGCNMCGFGGFA